MANPNFSAPANPSGPSRRQVDSSRPAPQHAKSPRRAQATLEMLIAFMELLVILQLLSMLARDGSMQMLRYSDAESRQTLSQNSLVIGMRLSDLEGRYIGLSGLAYASINGSGQFLTDSPPRVQVATLPNIVTGPNGAVFYAYPRQNEEIPN